MTTETRGVTAKFRVSRTEQVSKDEVRVQFMPDYADDRNKAWAKYTPAGSITLLVKKPIADEHFAQGQAFTVTFTPERG